MVFEYGRLEKLQPLPPDWASAEQLENSVSQQVLWHLNDRTHTGGVRAVFSRAWHNVKRRTR